MQNTVVEEILRTFPNTLAATRRQISALVGFFPDSSLEVIISLLVVVYRSFGDETEPSVGMQNGWRQSLRQLHPTDADAATVPPQHVPQAQAATNQDGPPPEIRSRSVSSQETLSTLTGGLDSLPVEVLNDAIDNEEEHEAGTTAVEEKEEERAGDFVSDTGATKGSEGMTSENSTLSPSFDMDGIDGSAGSSSQQEAEGADDFVSDTGATSRTEDSTLSPLVDMDGIDGSAGSSSQQEAGTFAEEKKEEEDEDTKPLAVPIQNFSTGDSDMALESVPLASSPTSNAIGVSSSENEHDGLLHPSTGQASVGAGADADLSTDDVTDEAAGNRDASRGGGGGGGGAGSTNHDNNPDQMAGCCIIL